MDTPMDILDLVPDNSHIYVVGALVRDSKGRVYVHRRSLTRKLFPGCWDVIGGHVEQAETLREALAREIREETSWTLDRVIRCVHQFDWVAAGVPRREYDFLVTIKGDLDRPVLETGKHDEFSWVTPSTLDRLLENREPDDRDIRDMVAAALNAA
jgi:8-oxo-dGTP pyrophosphatase MutT (NUDIX family)